MEVKAYMGMFVSSHVGSSGSIQSSCEHSLYRHNHRVIFHFYVYFFKKEDLGLNRSALFLFLKISHVSNVGHTHFLCCV